MPTGIINLAKNMPSMIGRNSSNNIVGRFESSSSSTLTPDMFQEPNMEGGHQLHALDMPQNTSESDDPRIREDEFNSATKSGSENHEGASEEDQDPRPNKKRYHRHTQHQIQEMEAFFKECPHPDDKKRKELSRELRLEPLQVKFWFQNKRTQMKAQQERLENSKLRDENDKLRADNMMYREALIKASCPDCGGPTAKGAVSFHEHHLRLENARLKEEIDRISGMAANAKHQGKQPVVDYSDISPPLPLRPLELDVGGLGSSLGGPPAAGGGGNGSSGGPAVVGGGGGGGSAGDLLRSINGPTEADKPMIIELAVAAMEELIGMAQMGEPLWVMATIDGPATLLDEDEYIRTFPRGIGPKPGGFRRETSRETAVVAMNYVDLVGILMDVNRWSTLFSGIVSRAKTLEVLSTGVVAGNYNGALQVMAAELQVPSPLVPTRESCFVRYCKKHADGTWAVVDVSLDNLLPGPSPRYRRRPSGCLIQEMPNGHSKVTWVEHAEVDGRGVHNLFKHLVSSGHAFGANRWVATLDRQCERLASAMASTVPTADVSVITSQGGRKSILKLAERMVASFCGGVSASTAQSWTTVTGAGADDVRVMTRKSVDDPGTPRGTVLSAATSFWLPVPPKRVFDFLRAENSRSQWDILSNGGVVQEIAHIANGQHSGNRVSLLRVNNSNNSSQSNMLVLQESCTDSSGSFVIYAPVDIAAINVVLNGGDPDFVALLPSGFAILPDGTTGHASGIAETNGPGGSLLTVAFQILVDSSPTAKLSLGSVSTVNHLIELTVERIKASLSGEAGA